MVRLFVYSKDRETVAVVCWWWLRCVSKQGQSRVSDGRDVHEFEIGNGVTGGISRFETAVTDAGRPLTCREWRWR